MEAPVSYQVRDAVIGLGVLGGMLVLFGGWFLFYTSAPRLARYFDDRDKSPEPGSSSNSRAPTRSIF
jgi:hypothetical protein